MLTNERLKEIESFLLDNIRLDIESKRYSDTVSELLKAYRKAKETLEFHEERAMERDEYD